jgi:predicted secreted protein
MTKQAKIEQLKLSSNDIFVELLKKEIPFAVMISVNSFKVSSDYFSRYYHILIHSNDTEKVKKYTFPLSRDMKGVCEHKLTTEQIEAFKKKMEMFEKVLHNKFGRIYELKGNSFKEYYKNQIIEN